MKTRKLIFIFLLSTLSISAQEIDTVKVRNNFLTLNLTSPIISFSPRLGVGFIKPVHEKWYVGLEAGYGTAGSSLSFILDSERATKAYRLWEIRPQLFYILNPEKKTNWYFSAAFFYIRHTDRFFDGRYVVGSGGSNPTEVRYERADYLRRKVGLNIHYGLFVYLGKNVGLNMSTGLGIRNRNVRYSNVINPVESEDTNGGISFFETDSYLENSGNHVGLNFVFDIKFFIKI